MHSLDTLSLGQPTEGTAGMLQLLEALSDSGTSASCSNIKLTFDSIEFNFDPSCKEQLFEKVKGLTGLRRLFDSGGVALTSMHCGLSPSATPLSQLTFLHIESGFTNPTKLLRLFQSALPALTTVRHCQH